MKETEFSLREPQQTCEFGKEDGIKGIRPIYRSNRLTETFPLIYGSTYLIQRLLHQNCSLLWFVRLFRVVPDCFDWELTDGNRVRGSLNSVYNHYGINSNSYGTFGTTEHNKYGTSILDDSPSGTIPIPAGRGGSKRESEFSG